MRCLGETLYSTSDSDDASYDPGSDDDDEDGYSSSSGSITSDSLSFESSPSDSESPSSSDEEMVDETEETDSSGPPSPVLDPAFFSYRRCPADIYRTDRTTRSSFVFDDQHVEDALTALDQGASLMSIFTCPSFHLQLRGMFFPPSFRIF